MDPLERAEALRRAMDALKHSMEEVQSVAGKEQLAQTLRQLQAESAQVADQLKTVGAAAQVAFETAAAKVESAEKSIERTQARMRGLKDEIAATADQAHKGDLQKQYAEANRELERLNANLAKLNKTEAKARVTVTETKAAEKTAETVSSTARSGAGRVERSAAAQGAQGAALTGAAVGGVVTGIVAAGKALLQLPEIINSAAAPIKNLVEAFDPGAAQQFGFVIRDLSASMGAVLVPVLDTIGGFTNQINSVITQLQPAVAPLIDMVSQITGQLGGQILGALVPILTMLVPVFGQIIEGARPFYEALGPLLGQLSPIIGQLITIGLVPVMQQFRVMQPMLAATVGLLTMLGPPIGDLLGIFMSLQGVFTPIIDWIMPLFTLALTSVATVIREVVGVIAGAIRVLKFMVDNITTLGSWTAANFAREFAAGRDASIRAPQTIAPQAPGGPTTQAAGQNRFIGTVEAQKEFQLAALRAAGSEQQRNTEATQRNTDAIRDNSSWLERFRQELERRRGGGDADRDFSSTGVGGSW